jgi:signal transduction histidine kinase
LSGAGQKLYVALDEARLSSLDSHTSLLCSIIWAIAGLVVLAGILMAIIGARHLAAPITQLANAVTGGLQANTLLPGHERSDEIGMLSRALFELISRLQETLERERAFTRHASHELRTPLSVMRNSLAVLRLPQCNDDKVARNLDRLEQASSEMETMVQLFLYLGREDERLPIQAVPILPVVQACQRKYARLIERKKQRVSVEIDPQLSVDAPRSALHVLIRNLMGNAVHHGEDFVVLHVDASHLMISNGVRSGGAPSHGFGYGLAIIQRLSQYCGWQLNIERNLKTFTVRVDFKRFE